MSRRWRFLLVDLLFLVIIFFSIRIVRYVTPTLDASELYFTPGVNELEMNERRVNIFKEIVAMEIGKVQEPVKVDSYEIRIVTSQRPYQYLTQTIGALLQHLKPELPRMAICNTEGRMFQELAYFSRFITVYDIGQVANNQTITKEAIDYWKCLSLPTTSRYIIALEDDALIHPSFPFLMNSLVKILDESEDVDYVKLYHPNHLRKIPSIPYTIGISMLVVIIYSLLRPTPPKIYEYLILSCIVYVVLRAHGPQLLADVRFAIKGSAYLSSTESCCTPAVVFRTSSVANMVAELSSNPATEGHAKDHILDGSSFSGLQSDNNWVTHIGFYSSVRKRMIKLADTRR